jgi:hypothetical protein
MKTDYEAHPAVGNGKMSTVASSFITRKQGWSPHRIYHENYAQESNDHRRRFSTAAAITVVAGQLDMTALVVAHPGNAKSVPQRKSNKSEPADVIGSVVLVHGAWATGLVGPVSSGRCSLWDSKTIT